MESSSKFSTRLRSLIDTDETVQLPGAQNGLAARVLDHVGFDAIYMTGYGTSLTMGLPDAGLISMPEMIRNANNIQEAVSVPLLADADEGYGNATNVIRTVREYIKTGVGGIHIEDQTTPKRCGHVSGRQVIPKREATGKFEAASDIRDQRDEDFVIVARTDARGAVDGSLDEAIDRVNSYCEAGADVAFIEGPTDVDELERIGNEVDYPLLYNNYGISPNVKPKALQSLGFDLVIYPGLGMKAAVLGIYEYAEEFQSDGTSGIEALRRQFDSELPFELNDLAGFPEVVDWEREYMPSEEENKYENSLGDDIGVE